MSRNSIGLIVALCKFDVLKTSTCALEASRANICFKNKSQRGNYQSTFLDRNTLLFT